MEVDKSRAALTSGETPLPLCGGEAELTSRAALTSGETPLPLCSRAPPAPIFARWPLDFFHVGGRSKVEGLGRTKVE